MSTIDDKRAQILLDFIVNMATFLIIINFGYLILSWLVELIMSLVNFWTNDQLITVADKIAEIDPTIRMIVGISSILISLLLTLKKMQPSFAALNLPESTITSQDVPNINGFDPATKQRLENVLTILIKVITVAVVATLVLDILHFVLTHSSEVLTAGSVPILIIGIPTIIGLFVLRIIIRNK